MTERASDLLSELSVRLTADLQEAGATASEAIRTSMPELVLTVPESFSEMPIRSSSQFLEALYRTLRGDLDYTEARHQARQTELHGLYHIASALGRSLDVTEIAEVGLSETLQVLNLQAGAAWVREGARLKLAKTLGLEPGQESEFSVSGRPGPLKAMEIGP